MTVLNFCENFRTRSSFIRLSLRWMHRITALQRIALRVRCTQKPTVAAAASMQRGHAHTALSQTRESQSRSRFEGWTLDIGRTRWERNVRRDWMREEEGEREWRREEREREARGRGVALIDPRTYLPLHRCLCSLLSPLRSLFSLQFQHCVCRCLLLYIIRCYASVKGIYFYFSTLDFVLYLINTICSSYLLNIEFPLRWKRKNVILGIK